MRKILLAVVVLTASLLAGDVWQSKDLVQPKDVAADIRSPLLLYVGFPVLFRAAHIPGSVYAGPGSKTEGIEMLKKAVEGQPKNRAIIVYCGCCPWEKCPNMRPAFTALREMGYTNLKAMAIPENLKTDWTDKGYPIERRAE
ncbi:MAG: rhodanese-like domain-containing protein [Acidobacteriia bacterium]|jgi:thiosulfate/3-mercaptopyruvate sulfurtransferase|nr:rhodanese-like domain-containing protein [Terriglobia bacterium]